MSFDKTPTTWLANWSEDGTTITVPIATFPEMTAAEADAATGDIRKIVFAIVEKLWKSYNATVTADRPNKWQMTKTVTANAIRNVLSHRYMITLETEIGTQEVSDDTSSSPTATSSSTASATSSGTATSTPTSSSSSSGTSTSTASASASYSHSATLSPTITPSASASASASATSTGTATASSSGTSTSTPTSSSTLSGSATASATATA
jgi:hypothetical protein